jgi:sugar lactone lactonase YvrE
MEVMQRHTGIPTESATAVGCCVPGHLDLKENEMSTVRRLPRWKGEARRTVATLGGVLLTLAASPPTHAVTSVTVDGHPNPVTLTAGETITLRFDVAKPGGPVNLRFARDLAGSGKFDPAAPRIPAPSFTDGSGQDTDPTPGKLAVPFYVPPDGAAGLYVLQLQDPADNSTVELSGVTMAPKPQLQAISGRVAVVTAANPAGTVPADAIVWAYDTAQQPVANTSIRRDGTYSLPLPPGTYTVFAEWFGNLHSLRQVVTLSPNQQHPGIDLPLLQGQEVSGTVSDGASRIADALVSADGGAFTTRTLADGSYVLVLPPGPHQITARGMTEPVTVADGPVDGVDFPPAPPGPAPGPGTIVTVAGNGIAGYGGEGRLATAARLLNLQGVAVDKAGNLSISLNGVQRIRRVAAATGIITTIAGGVPFEIIRGLQPGLGAGGYGGDGGPATQARLNNPQHLALDQAGNLYVSEAFNHRVRKIDLNGIITTVAGTGQIGFAGDGGPATEAQLNTPQGIAIDAAGNLYIAESINRRVRKVSPAGLITTVAGGGTAAVTEGARATEITLGALWGLATDSAGNLFIGDRTLNRILKMNPAGTMSIVAGTGKAGFSGDGGLATQAEINLPRHMVVDRAGNLFFADQNNHRVRKVSAEGSITTVAGSGPVGAGVPGAFAGDGGPATEARLNTPMGLAIDAGGNLILVDQGNNRVRQVIGIAAPGLIAGQ